MAGLDRATENFMDCDELFGDEDLDVAGEISSGGRVSGGGAGVAGSSKQQAADLLVNMEGLSARERNKLKRKAKALSRADSVKSQDSLKSPKVGTASAGPAGTTATQASADSGDAAGHHRGAGDTDGGAEADEEEWKAIIAGAWPFQRLCDQLCVDLLDPVWEVRHGAALALREVLRTHAGCAGVEAPMADEVSGWATAGGTGAARWGVKQSNVRYVTYVSSCIAKCAMTCFNDLYKVLKYCSG